MPGDLLPETAGPWRRTAIQDAPASGAPDPVPRSAVVRLRRAEYRGPGKLEARVYQLTSTGVALDLVQRWRPSADTVFFYAGRYFVVVKWEDADRAALRSFVQDLEKRIRLKS
jgi:hypothetical protein